jgi:hypothetical protein
LTSSEDSRNRGIVKFQPQLTDEIAYASDDRICVMQGKKTGHALGVVPFAGGWASMMLLAGRMLADGFATYAQACAFNEAIVNELGAACGACDVEDFFTRAGGEDKARAAVEKIRRKVTKEQA